MVTEDSQSSVIAIVQTAPVATLSPEDAAAIYDLHIAYRNSLEVSMGAEVTAVVTEALVPEVVPTVVGVVVLAELPQAANATTPRAVSTLAGANRRITLLSFVSFLTRPYAGRGARKVRPKSKVWRQRRDPTWLGSS